MKSIKISDYLQIVNPDYVYLQVTPDTSIRNYDSSNIAKSISHMYKSITEQITRQEDYLHWYNIRFKFEKPVKCSYLIDIHKDNVFFYFIIPSRYKNSIKEKITATWKKAKIDEIPEIKEFSNEALKYQMNYKKEDALSLAVDKKSNEPLNSIFNVIDIMQESDRIGIFYNFIPCSQLLFKKEYNDTLLKIKSNKPIDKEKFNPKYVFKVGMSYLLDILDSIVEVINDFTGGVTNKKNESISLLEIAAEVLNSSKSLSIASKKKKDETVINTQMLILSESIDKHRKNANAVSVCQSYKGIEEQNDALYKNELVYKKLKNKNVFHINDLCIAGAETNKVSTEECQNFIQLPGRDLLNQYKSIEKINVLESEVPLELQTGTKLIGLSEYKGNKRSAFLTSDKDYKNLALVVIGPTRSGKTSLLGNLSRNSIDAGECVIVLDYIENCGLSDDIKTCIPPDKILEINLYDYNCLQGLGYNEALVDSNDVFIQYESAKKQTSQLLALVNSINDDESLKSRMEKYLEAAALVTFIQHGPIKVVFDVLQNHVIRKKYIDSIPEVHKEYLEDYIIALSEIDEWSKATQNNPAIITGTKTSFIQGILNRVAKMKSNTYMELMLKKDCSKNINLLDEMEKNQVIFIKMPEQMFSTPEERDLMVTYWLTKIWMAGQARAWKIKDRYKRKTVNVITDEIAQLENAEHFMGKKLDQTAKFGIKFILSTMYINQLKIREKLRTANTSYILISGSEKGNFKELKEEFEQHGYALEDLMNLKRYTSLNYIKYENGYWAGITQLPKPIK